MSLCRCYFAVLSNVSGRSCARSVCAPAQGSGPRIPFVTLIVVGISALVYLLPQTHAPFVYNRSAILGGEFWRAVTCHWVHFSRQHFTYDTAAFGVAGWIIEQRGYRNFGCLCVFAVFAISASMLLCEPRLEVCGGLSGLATAAAVFLALHGLEEKGLWRWICVTTLVLGGAKTVFELTTQHFVLLQEQGSYVPVPANHIAGGLTATAFYLCGRRGVPDS